MIDSWTPCIPANLRFSFSSGTKRDGKPRKLSSLQTRRHVNLCHFEVSASCNQQEFISEEKNVGPRVNSLPLSNSKVRVLTSMWKRENANYASTRQLPSGGRIPEANHMWVGAKTRFLIFGCVPFFLPLCREGKCSHNRPRSSPTC